MRIVTKIFCDPLFHFLILGALIFVGHGLASQANECQSGGAGFSAQRIRLTGTDVNLMVEEWRKLNFRAPSTRELDVLIDKRIQEEVLYREALGFGLDKNDTIVRRRLAQKMAFFSEGLITTAEPTVAELKAYLADHPERFAAPVSIRFEQVYFDPELHEGRALEKIINDTLISLQNGAIADSTNAGDRFLLGTPEKSVSASRVGSTFGQEFVTSLFATAPGSWQGPIASAFGQHLVYIYEFNKPPAPTLEEVGERVKEAFLSDGRQNAVSTYYTAAREEYQIEVDRTGVEVLLSLPEPVTLK
jgi:hypothetical protein